jgi:hypothetical protein
MSHALISISEYNSFDCWALDPIFKHHFDVAYDFNCADPNKNALLWFGSPWTGQEEKQQQALRFLEDGGKLIADGLWECFSFDLSQFDQYQNQILVLRSGASTGHDKFNTIVLENWFWFHEALMYTARGYDQYRPVRNLTHTFLMPIGRMKLNRARWLEKIHHCLDRSLWSSLDQERYLPDFPEVRYQRSKNSYLENINDTRLFLPQWYDCTEFSVVMETYIDNVNFPRFITEKTYKPLAFFHPFVIIGQPGVLAHLHKLGFETWPELFDESYDSETDDIKREDLIVKQILNFDYGSSINDPIVQQKLKHNHSRFFDMDFIKAQISECLIHPILEFLEKKS